MINKKHELDDFLGPEEQGHSSSQAKQESPMQKAEREVNEALLRYSGKLLVSKEDLEKAQDDIRVLASIHAQRQHAKNQEIDQLEKMLRGEDKYAHKGKEEIPLSASKTRQDVKHFGLAFERLTKIFNRPEYTDLVQAIFRLENLRKKELSEKDKQITTLKSDVKKAQAVRAELSQESKKTTDEMKAQSGENKNSINPEPTLMPQIDALEDELLNQLNAYSEKKTLKGHAEKLRTEFKELGYTYELIYGDKWKEARTLRKALESSSGEPAPQPIKRAGITDSLKIHVQEAKTLLRGLGRISPVKPGIIPLNPLVNTTEVLVPETEKRAYAKVLIAFEKLQHMRRKEMKRLNREIRNLRKALKEKKEVRRESTEIWDYEDDSKAA